MNSANTKGKILVYGSLNVDFIFSVDCIVCPGETISSGSLEKSAGGKGANQVAALAKAGMEAYIAGKIGRDGLFLLDLLKSYGANTEFVKIYEGVTGQAIIQVDRNGQNAIVLFPGGNGCIEPGEIGEAIGSFGEGDSILLQNEIPLTGKIMETAKKRGMMICLNPSPYNEKIEQLPLDLTDIFFVNEIEGAAMAGLGLQAPPTAILDKLTKRFPGKELILTAGKEGAYYGCDEKRAKGDIVDCPVVDTTGAGDTFTGYFLAARFRGMDITSSLQLACKASSIAVTRKGAMEAIPFKEEVF
jgi:ribokinase